MLLAGDSVVLPVFALRRIGACTALAMGEAAVESLLNGRSTAS